MKPLTVFLVDDDPVAHKVARFALDGSVHQIHEFMSGKGFLESKHLNPDIVLLDVEMPDMDGIQVCRTLRLAGYDHPKIIFVSSRDDLVTRLAAYDAGGDYYLIKPYEVDELARTVKVVSRAQLARRSLSEQSRVASQTAFTAMSSMGEMGVTVEFLRTLVACRNPNDLALAIFRALQQYDLHGLLGLVMDGREFCFSSVNTVNGECSEQEASILRHTRGMERLFQFGERLVINYPEVTLVAFNLSRDDSERNGRLRDHLAAIAEAVQSSLAPMQAHMRLHDHAEKVQQVVGEFSVVLDEIRQRQRDNRMHILHAGNTLLEELDRAFIHLGLSDAQESHLHALASNAMNGIADILTSGRALESHLHDGIIRLRDIARGGAPMPLKTTKGGH